MRLPEAQNLADRITRNSPECKARVVRVLPEELDPPTDNDNGWDVEIEVSERQLEKLI
jgi:hypothetical protein